ncbi:uncharacterized protein PITG_07360 [Phytophthora infestans T30-4]|uniref:Uncharacterized protein n=1 Tax=Phytophthora infestans (strain T30-4) TaxID=403677 RepID=D0N882_PHYIT|nr:uncharacterized protein PITG_07360 [Phytophthora infestans T30-4]EEY53767.1 conserved hypothetical protein [Phytophthora infestans T30-4]|eukprot:XP_002904398.1 conserved hypothetical protein [Phytophthora infestans T30-4]
MSTASDISAFEHSILDSTSSTGAGQIQFNLSTISSQYAFVNWEEAVIDLPIKLQILNAGESSVTSTAACTVDQLVPKADAWQFIDSVQAVVDGVTVQTNQVHENVNATFKALTEWDYNSYIKRGPTSSFVLDEYRLPIPGVAQNLDNMAASNYISGTAGEWGLFNTFSNGGARKYTSRPAGAVAAGAPFSVAHYLACLKLSGLSDYFKKCTMQRNKKGFMYINYNCCATSIPTGGSAGTVAATNIASINSNMNFGNTCPILWNGTSANTTNTGESSGLAVPGSTHLLVTADVNGTATSGSGIAPSQTFSRQLAPTYSPNQSADNALIQKKTFRYIERVTNKFTAHAGPLFTWTVTNGIANPKKLIMQPVITNVTPESSSLPDVINLFRSCFSTMPNVPIWNNPVNFGYDLFRLWESLYRFIAVDIGRRLPSEDGAGKSIIVSGTNNTNYALTIYSHILREVVATVDTAMDTVFLGAQKAYDRYYNAMTKTASFRPR